MDDDVDSCIRKGQKTFFKEIFLNSWPPLDTFGKFVVSLRRKTLFFHEKNTVLVVYEARTLLPYLGKFSTKNDLSFSPSLFVFVNFALDDQQPEEQDREEKSSV